MGIQAVLFPVGSWSPARAETWLRLHGLRPIKRTLEGHFYRYRLVPPYRYRRFATKVLRHSCLPIHLVLGFR
jgi:hypothetical protein